MGGKSYEFCLDPALDFLENLEWPDEIHEGYSDDSVSDFSDSRSSENSHARYGDYNHLAGSIEMMILELRFLKMFLWGLAYWEELKYDWHLRFAINTVMVKCSQIAEEFEANCRRVLDEDQRINWEAMIYDLEKAIQQFKPQVKDICLHLLDGGFECTSCPPKRKFFVEYSADTASFIVFILSNMVALLNPDSNFISPVMKQQILLIHQELGEFGMFADPFSRLCDLISRSRTCSNCISCLLYLCWIDGKNESAVSALEALLSGLRHKTKPCSTPGVISSYFQGEIIPRLLASSIDFLLEDMAIPMMRSDIEEGLIFLLSFIMEPPEDDSENGEMIWAKIYGCINKFPSLIYSIRTGKFRQSSFSDFLRMIETAKAKVRKLYLVTPYSSHGTSANSNVIGFLNLLIRDLKKMLLGEVDLIPSLKHLCELVRTELESLRPVVNRIMELVQEDESEEIRDLWRKISSMIYNADYFIKFCLPGSFSVWYGIIALPDVIEDIKLIKTDMGNIGFDKIQKKEKPIRYKEGTDTFPQLRGTASEFEGAFIGFKELARVIIDDLTRGAKSLTIISISGSAGQGKTTLAKRIYGDRNTGYHFHRRAWCYISKECLLRDILLRIIRDVTEGDDRKKTDFKNLDLIGLSEHLRKSLKGRRYLIVMDDIWDVDVWRDLKCSFPDDKNGSRILFTSRNHDLASQAQSNSMSHCLPLFSDEESWELMKRKVFGCDEHDGCPLEFLEIGEKIASYCKGLPLAVVLIAAILGRIERKLDLWDEVAENLKSHLAREGCGNVIELSYKYLPDHLKPCFLYFGVFPRGKNVRAKKLKLLWISEGFMSQDHETQSSDEDLATDYLNKLASLSLVSVTKRSSMGGIKRCNVHDLLYDLCLEKGKEENFLNMAEESSVVEDEELDILSCGKLHRCNHIRLRIGTSDPFIKSSPIATKRELPTSSLHSLLWSSNSYFIDSSFDLLESFKVLTVLDLDFHRVREEFGEFPEVILCMIHLRYLALQLMHFISEIPPEIANLWNLETLVISHISSTSVSLPVSMWKMKSLRHVNIEWAHLDLEDFDLNGSECSNIETLGAIHLVCNSRTEEFLRKFPKLRKLNCSFQGKEHIFKLFSMFESLTQLEVVKVCHPEGLDRGPHDKKPVFDSPVRIENLKKLVLNGLLLPWSVVSLIGKQLPNLEVLKLLSDSCEGSCWKLEDGDFLKLRYLKLSYLQEIKEMDVSGCDDNRPFPCLEHLIVESCTKFEKIPSEFGEICNLKTVEVSLCSEEVDGSVLQILEQQREWGNHSFHVGITKKTVFHFSSQMKENIGTTSASSSSGENANFQTIVFL